MPKRLKDLRVGHELEIETADEAGTARIVDVHKNQAGEVEWIYCIDRNTNTGFLVDVDAAPPAKLRAKPAKLGGVHPQPKKAAKVKHQGQDVTP